MSFNPDATTRFEKSSFVAPVQGTSKSPVQNTSEPEFGVSVHLDWASFTMPSILTPEFISQHFFNVPLHLWTKVDKFLHGYKTRYMWGNVLMLVDGGEDRGIHIDISGSGCRQVETAVFQYAETPVNDDYVSSIAFERDWSQFFGQVFAYGGDFTRVDLACDQRFEQENQAYFTYDKLLSSLERGDFVSHWDGFLENKKFAKSGGKSVVTGRSFYLGSKASDVFACVYDKALERKSKGVDVDGSWLRWEMRFKHKRASKVAVLLSGSEDFAQWFTGICGEYIRFTDPSSTDSNKSRRETVGWWSEFLGACERIKLTFAKTEKTLRAKQQWLSRSVSISLAQLREFYLRKSGNEKVNRYEFSKFLFSLVESGSRKMRDLHFNQVEGWLSLERSTVEGNLCSGSASLA